MPITHFTVFPFRAVLAYLCLATAPFAASKTPPDGVVPVDHFQLERYLGLWYEIARTDNPFERNLESVTAEYTLREDGGIHVHNRGWNTKKHKWSEVRGRAYQIGDANEASLKVTFFWPFYAGYHVFELDHEGYQYALVSGDKHSYMWILARQQNLSKDTIDSLLEKAKKAGFPVDELVWVDHETARPASDDE